MFSDPEIVETDDLSVRAYVKTYINGERYRLYNGRDIGVKCNPNRAATLKERTKFLQELSYQFKKKLEKGWLPNTPIPATEKIKEIVTVEEVFKSYPE